MELRTAGESALSLRKRLRDAVFDSLVPPEIAARQRPLSDSARKELEEALRRHYFSQPLNYFAATPEEYLASPEGRSDMADHVIGRAIATRRLVIPWLASALPLEGCRNPRDRLRNRRIDRCPGRAGLRSRRRGRQ